MSCLRFILGDQLSHSISCLKDLDEGDLVLMVEVQEEAIYVPHHKQKIALILSAMRHFAMELSVRGVQVDYVELDDPGNTGTFTGELARALQRHDVERIVLTEPSEFRVDAMVRAWSEELSMPVDILQDDRQLCSRDEFGEWSAGRKTLRMEYFYREIRRKTGWLMVVDQPEGEQWNYDVENRKKLPRGHRLPTREGFRPDEITLKVLSLVELRFHDHFGSLKDFAWAVSRAEALEALETFIVDCLPQFGDYQDAMKAGEDFLYHSLLSPYINLGLLLPREVCEAALQAYDEGIAPLAAVEGFVRQVAGWREFIRGLYWLKMPAYAESNFLEAKRPLPALYWNGETSMHCMSEAIRTTKDKAYAHHIQRLMVTGNFALLAGLKPQEVEAWYLAVYIDAFEWVELPNTHGMALHADGGEVGSKPYAASGSYINRMSDYCKSCIYDPKVKTGPKACPFNYLYWNFLIENQDRLSRNPRMGLPYRNLQRMTEERKLEIRQDATHFLDGLV